MTKKEINRLSRTPPQTGRMPVATLIKWVTRIFFCCSLLILLLCVIRLAFRITNGGPVDWLSELPFLGGISLGEWCAKYAQCNVLSSIFVAMGLIHASFSLIVTVREKTLYGVNLQDAMQEVFPFLGWSYVSYALLILLGMYASGMNYSLTALMCLAGTLFGFSTPWIVTAFLTFGRHPQQVVVEYYLCYHKYPKQGKKLVRGGTLTHILTSAHYINGYYKSTQAVPVNVMLRTWQGFTVLAFGTDLLTPDSKSRNEELDVTLEQIQGTAQIIVGVRRFWQYILQDVPDQEQAAFIRQILNIAVRDYSTLPENADHFFTAPNHNKALLEDHAQMILPLSGLISYLREQTESPLSRGYWESWIQCFRYLYLISSFSPNARFPYGAKDVDNVEKSDFSVRMLFLLMLAVLLGELSTMELNDLDDLKNAPDGNDLWVLIKQLARVFHVSISWIPRFLSWGMSIIFSYSADWFGSVQGILSLYDTYQWLSCILDAADSTGDNQEVS